MKSLAMGAGVFAALVTLAGGVYFFGSRPGPAVPPTAVAKTSPGAGNPAKTDTPHLVSTSPLPGPLVQKTEVSLPQFPTKPKATSASAASGLKPVKPARHVPKTPHPPKTASQGAVAVLPADAVPSAEATNKADTPATVLKQVQQFAFLKVGSSPQGARVYINGAQKGTTPMIVRLDLGHYQVRFSRAGYRDVERQLTLEKMMEYPLSETLTPTE
jgi:hypothetical protein